RLRPGLPADRRGAALRHSAAAEEDQAHHHDRPLMTQAQQQELAEHVKAQLPLETGDWQLQRDELIVWAKREAVVKVLTFLRDDRYCLSRLVADVWGVAYRHRRERFGVVYNLRSRKHNRRIRIKVAVDEETPVPSATGVYSSAGWYEREVWDLYGVFF